MKKSKKPPRRDVVTDHRRQWRDCSYVYPVISRRAGGLSIGVNLSIDKRCNFGCLYCQIDRRIERPAMEVIIPQLRRELDAALTAATTGSLWQEDRFAETPADMRRINDIAFSGDGEPTRLETFDLAVQAAADAIHQHSLAGKVKIVVITNSSLLVSPQMRRALKILNEMNGEIWAKLDAGTEDFFQQVNRPAAGLNLANICDGIREASTACPLTIQTLFFRLDSQPPSRDEINAYIDRLRHIIDTGGRIRLVQLHTIARSPASSQVSTLPDDQLDAIAETVRQAIAPIPVKTYYGRNVPPQG
ncbi:MAG: radical SAM protein [Phycisphaerae bacterium]|nr:radical SAM protein [Phycisphaerae bacterium]